MAQIVNYKDWLKRTNYDWRHARSTDLKKLDKAVEYYFVNWKGAYHDAAKGALLTEFEKYCKKKWQEDPKYKPSNVMGITLSQYHPRNTNGAFEDLRNTLASNVFWVDKNMQAAQSALMDGQASLLDRLLYSPTGVPLQFTLKAKISSSEKFLRGCRAIGVAVPAQFNGGKTFNPGYSPASGSSGQSKLIGAGEYAKAGYQGGRAGYQVGKAIEHIEDHVAVAPHNYGPLAIKELTPLLGNSIAQHVGHALAEAAPFIGHIISGGKLLKAAHDVAKVHMLKNDLSKLSNMGFIAPNSPQAAMDAVIALYGRIATQKELDLGMAAVKFGAQFDPTRAASSVVGAADAVRKIMTMLAVLIMELRETEAANDIITKKLYKTDFEQMFVSCPLLGAYVIMGSETSSIINVAVKYYGTNGWNVQVESMRKSIQKLYTASDAVLAKSKYEIVGFPKRAMYLQDIPSPWVSQSVRATQVNERIVGFGGKA